MYYCLNATSSTVFMTQSCPTISAPLESGSADKRFHRRLVRAAGLGVRRPQRSRIIPSFYVHPCRCLCTLVPCSLGATVSTKRCRLRRLEYSFTGGSRLGKRAEGVHYDPPLRRHIRIDGGHSRGLKGSYCQFRNAFLLLKTKLEIEQRVFCCPLWGEGVTCHMLTRHMRRTQLR